MSSFSGLDLFVVVIYLVGIGWLGVSQARKVHNAGDFFAGGRRFNKWLMMMHSLGTGTHADDPVGVAGAAYQRGISGIWYTYVYLFCTPFYWLIAPLFRRSRLLTTADFFTARFSRGLGLLYAIMGVLIFSVNTGTMLKGTGTIVTAVTGGMVPEWLAIAAMTVAFVIYGTAGGLIATVITESVQGLLIVVMSLLLVPYGLHVVGGFSGLHELLTPDKFSLAAPEEMTLPWIIAASLGSLIGIVAQPHTMEVCAAGKTEWEGRVGFTYGSFIKRICAMGWALTGLLVLAMVANGSLAAPLGKREEAFGVAIRELLPPGATGLMFAAVLAAQMSTLSAFMVAGSALLSRNIYRGHLRLAATDADMLRVGRYAGLIVVALGVVFALHIGGVADALTYFWALNSLLGLSMWFAVLWRPTNATGAWVSFVVMALIWLAQGPVGARYGPLGWFGDKQDLHLLLMSYLPAGAVALVVGSLASRPGKRARKAAIWLVLLAAFAAFMLVPTSFTTRVPHGPWGPVWHMLGVDALLAAAAALIALIVGLFVRKGRDEAAQERFRMLLRTPVGREQELADAGVDVVYAGESTGHPWELRHPRLVSAGGFAFALLVALAVLGLLMYVSSLGA
jgi:Na+/proline symporter